MGPALGTAPTRGPWGFRHHRTSRRQTPTSAQARHRAGNGEERGEPYALATMPRSRSRAPTSRTASAPPQSGAHGLVASQNIPQRKLCGPSPRHGARPRPVGVPSSQNLEAPDAHQRASMPQGRERGRAGANPTRSQPPHAPALEPPQATRRPPRLSQGPMVSSPPRTSHSESFAGPALGTAPARGPWGFRHHGPPARRSQTGAARLSTGGEEESARMGDSNPGCNYLVRG